MPWKLKKKGAQVCVVKEDTGEEVHCHGTRAQAVAQMRALYASEKKELSKEAIDSILDTYADASDEVILKDLGDDEVLSKAVWTTAYVNNLPDSAFLYVEDGEQDSEGKTTPRSKRHLPYKNKDGQVDAAHTRNAIARIPQMKGVPDATKKRLQSKARRILAGVDKELEKGWYQTGEINPYGGYKEEYVPDNIVSFSDLDAYETSKEMTEQAQEEVGKFKAMVDNIFSPWSGIQNRVAAINKLTSEFVSRLGHPEEPMEMKSLTEPIPDPDPDFSVYKDTEGKWLWKGCYSNNQLDRSTPPDRLTDQAHRIFAYMVKEDIVPKPPLLAWHLDGFSPATTDSVWYDDDTGQAWASGAFKPGYEYVAEWLSTQKDIKMSHRMPVALISRDPADPLAITTYVSTEFSYLPSAAAANEGTTFGVSKEKAMLTEEKKEFLKKQGVPDEQLAVIANLSKEVTEPVVEKAEPTEPVKVTETPEPVTEPVTKETKDETEAQTKALRDEIAEGFQALGSALKAQQDQIKSIVELVQTQAETIQTLQKSDEAKLKDKLDGTPTMSRSSFKSIIDSAIGLDNDTAKSTKIDGRTLLAKDKPVEAPDGANQDLWSTLTIKGDGDWRKTLPPAGE